MSPYLFDYLITLGWAVVGSIAMGISLIIVLNIYNLSTKSINEWEELEKNNISIAIIKASLILACAWVVSSNLQP